MRKLYDGRCVNTDCERSGEVVEVWAEGVGEGDVLVDAECEECRGLVERVLSPIRFGRHSSSDSGRNPGDGCAGGGVELHIYTGEDGPMRAGAVLDGRHEENCASAKLAEAINGGDGIVGVGVLVSRSTDRNGHTLH